MAAATLHYVHQTVIPAAMAMLPPRLDSVRARAMLLAIALQESQLFYRVQVAGPARGFWQMEQGGAVRGVMRHSLTRPLLEPVLATLCYPFSVQGCYDALAHNDILACVFARLLLWTAPEEMPAADAAADGWEIYLATWRPGRPHPSTWVPNFRRAWNPDTVELPV